MKNLAFVAALGASAFLTLACGASGGDGGSDGAMTSVLENAPGTCRSAGTRICERACSCPGDGKCRVGTKTTAGVATMSFDDAEKCLDWFVDLACMAGDEPGRDYAACESKMAAAMCEPAAGGARAVVLPAECKSTDQ